MNKFMKDTTRTILVNNSVSVDDMKRKAAIEILSDEVLFKLFCDEVEKYNVNKKLTGKAIVSSVITV